MRAVVQRRYGGTETWSVEEAPEPVPGPRDVLVDVRAAAIDKGTWHLMVGEPYLVRLFVGLRGPRRAVPGRDVAGVVVAVGSQVDGYGVGDEVYGSTLTGSLAERAVVSVDRLGHRPRSLSFEEAAATPISGWTALQALRRGDVAAGQRVMVIGASGGVGSFAVQLAASFGCEVTGTCSSSKVDLLQRLGVTRIVDHSKQDPTELVGDRFDVVLEIGSSARPLRQVRRLLTPTGTLVMVGGGEHGRVLGDQQRALGAALLSLTTRQRLRPFLSSENAEQLAELSRLADAGAFRPALDRVFSLGEAAKAMDHLAAGHARGKVVVVP